MVWTNRSIRLTRSISRSMVSAMAARSSEGSARLRASGRISPVRMGPIPMSSQWALVLVAVHRAWRNSALGACPFMNLRMVSWWVPVSSEISR